jgi:cobalt-zinc-cadmium efflux system membrane fusion protein
MKTRSNHRRWLAGLIAALAVGLTLAGCDGDKVGVSAKETAPKNPNEPQLFSIPQQQMSHVQVVTLAPTEITRTLRLTGAVAYNNFRTTPVITQVSGPVSRIVVSPGQKVRKGEPLLYVASPDYSQLRASYLKFKDAFELAEKNYIRAQDLYTHHAIAERDLQAAKSAEVQAQADMVAAAAALKVLGVTDPDSLANKPPSAEVPVLAPIGGEIVERLVSPGQVIQSGQTQCFTISDMSSVWVLVNVYQKDLPYVHVGDPVTIQTDTYPDVFHGRISYVAAALDATTRTLPARIETRNPGEKLKKDMYVVTSVQAGKIANALAVPDSAVLRDSENEPFVYAEVAPNQFGKRAVRLGEPQGGRTQITSGVKAGDRVIADGSLFLQFANSLQR